MTVNRSPADGDAPTLLVAGGTRVDAGKTTFSTGVLATLADRAGDAVGVKPRAGNDYWFDHDDYLTAASDGRLYGKDARRLAAASTRPLDGDGAGAVVPESINPLHRLWRPTPGRTGLLGEADRTFLCDRIAPADGESAADGGNATDGPAPRFVLNGAAADAGVVPADLTERLPVDDAVRVRDVDDLDAVTADRYLPAFERLADRVADAGIPVVVESYGDVAEPLPDAFDAVAVVDPGRARIYDGDRYSKACAVASRSPREGRLETHTDAVLEVIDPLATTALPALSAAERDDPGSVAERYARAYRALLDAA